MPPTRRERSRGWTCGVIDYSRSRSPPRSRCYQGYHFNGEDPNALYTSVNQVWDPQHSYPRGGWVTGTLEPPNVHVHANDKLIFKAYKRVYGPLGPSIDDHTWIDLESRALTEILKSEETLKGTGKLLHSQPGIDARHLFLRLHWLKERAVEPAIEDDTVLVSSSPPSDSASNNGLELENVLDSASAPESDNAPGPSVAGPAAMEIDPNAHNLSDAFSARIVGEEYPRAPTKPPLSVPEQLFVLAKFVEEHFEDTVTELERLKAEGYISFKLLWMLCSPGTIIQVQDGATGELAGMLVESWEYESCGKLFNIKGITYLWDGTVFKKELVQECISEFKGFMKLSQLSIKVLSDQVRGQLIERGKLYQKFAGVHHLGYNSFMLLPARCGHAKIQAKGRVMIDVAGYYQFHLNERSEPRDNGWDSPVRTTTGTIAGKYEPSEPLPDEVLCLTPPSLFGWSFRAKRWGLIHVEHVEEIVFNEMVFDQLVLKKSYKKMVKALVETHAGKEDSLAKDLIAGKGGGMVMVLHGKPGTGKTLTAEAISEHLKCPLYTVSSGELGTNASQLEGQLKDILEMTASWGAVVLIDEADVFLEARDTHDLTRNSLVSVFLRLLEYHTGVLILTTNRIRSFDKAFVSRFTIALNYPDLDQDSRLLIWKEFLRRAGFEFGGPNGSALSRPLYIAHSDLMAVADKPFNGRVIKQLVRGAQALAIAEKEPLELSHIHTVLEITEQFEADWEDTALVADVKGAGVSTLS